MSAFTSPLRVEFMNGRYWKILEAFTYCVGEPDSDECITVPVDFETDFASIPRCVWWLIGHPTGQYGKAAVIHDWLYEDNECQVCTMHPRTRKQCDQIFLEGMVVLGVSWWRRTLMYSAVRTCGGGAWGANRSDTEG